MALTFTSPEDQTTCGSSVGSKVRVLTSSAGPPAVRSATSEWRCAISPDWMKASAIIGTNVALSPVASKTPAKMHAGQSNASRSNAKYIFEQGQACIRLLHLLGYAHKDECRGQ